MLAKGKQIPNKTNTTVNTKPQAHKEPLPFPKQQASITTRRETLYTPKPPDHVSLLYCTTVSHTHLTPLSNKTEKRNKNHKVNTTQRPGDLLQARFLSRVRLSSKQHWWRSTSISTASIRLLKKALLLRILGCLFVLRLFACLSFAFCSVFSMCEVCRNKLQKKHTHI